MVTAMGIENGTLRVLLVDDEPDVGRYMKAMLNSKAPGLSIENVNSASECLSLMEGEGYVDCVLSDYQMPGMDGMELLKELRDKGFDTPFIFITGQGNEEIAREAFKQGANDYFTKDVGFAHFTRIINSIEQAVRQRQATVARDAAESSSYRHYRKLEALAQAVKLVNQVLEIPEVMRRLVSSAMTLVDGTSGAAGQHKDGVMVFKEYNMEGRILPIDYRFEPGYGVPGQVMLSMTAYVTNDAENDPHVLPEVQKTLGFTSLIDVPIISREGELLGCFEIHNKEDGSDFTDDDVAILGGLAAGAAVAIENAGLLESLSWASTEWEETFDAMDDLVTVHDPDFTVTKVNEAACEVLGLDRKDVVGAKYFDLFPLSDIHEVADVRRPYIPGRQNGGRESVMRHELKIHDRYYDASVYPIHVGGRLTGYVNVAKDITDRKLEVDKALRSRDVLSSILDSLELGVIVVGYDRRIRQVNRAALEMMGRDSSDEVVGRKCHEFICPAEEGCCPVLDLGQNVDLSERKLLDSEGRRKTVIKSVSPITLGGEQVLLETCLDPERRKKIKIDKAA